MGGGGGDYTAHPVFLKEGESEKKVMSPNPKIFSGSDAANSKIKVGRVSGLSSLSRLTHASEHALMHKGVGLVSEVGGWCKYVNSNL